MGLILGFFSIPLPLVFNVSNDGLAALMHVHMLDSDFLLTLPLHVLDGHLLLTLPSMLVEALKERCISAA